MEDGKICVEKMPRDAAETIDGATPELLPEILREPGGRERPEAGKREMRRD